jgi:AcrR family transcriptional regulator
MSRRDVFGSVGLYDRRVPKLWNETIEAHRRTVHDTILDTTAALAAAHGPLAVTMSQIAGSVGIGRATLYKYFPDVEAILIAWHEREVSAHFSLLAQARDQAAPARRLEAVLETYALIHHRHGGRHRHENFGAEIGALVHRDEHFTLARRRIHDLFRDVLAETDAVRDDAGPDELATYCEHALHAAAVLPDEAAVHRLVAITLSGLR